MADISSLPKPVDLIYEKYEPLTVDPDRSPILIHHDIFSSKEAWKISNKLAQQTRRVVYCFDCRCHGMSPTNDFSYVASIADVINFMNVNTIEKAMLIGHSLGGMVVSRLATLFVSFSV